MAERPKGYGYSAEVQQKLAAKYDPEREREAVAWIEAILGESIGASPGADNLHASLKDGVVLCKLINRIKPASVKKVNDSKMAFKQMENISNFLNALDSYGVSKTDLFQTVDLYEQQNMASVVNTLHALGRKAQANGFDGPTLGPKESSENKREFTEEQKRAGSGIIGLQMGSNKGASQAGMTFGASRRIEEHGDVS